MYPTIGLIHSNKTSQWLMKHTWAALKFSWCLRHYRIHTEARTPAFKNSSHIEIRMSCGNLSASLHNFLGRIEPKPSQNTISFKWNKTKQIFARTHAFVDWSKTNTHFNHSVTHDTVDGGWHWFRRFFIIIRVKTVRVPKVRYACCFNRIFVICLRSKIPHREICLPAFYAFLHALFIFREWDSWVSCCLLTNIFDLSSFALDGLG